MTTEKCILCGELSGYNAGLTNSNFNVKCNMCGPYSYSSRAQAKIQKSADKVAAVLRERRLKGYPSVFIVLEREGAVENWMTLDEILALYPRNASEMIDRAFLNLVAKVEHPCDRVSFALKDYPLVFARASTKEQDVQGMVALLVSLGYIQDQKWIRDVTDFKLTPAGWSKIEELRKSSIDSKQVFVAMWFDPQMEAVYSDGIKPAIEKDTEYRALKMDLKEHNDKICDQIIAEIRRSKFMVADFTGNRGGVYFESGYAKGLGIPVIWTVHKDDLPNVHFDTRQYNHIDYETPADLQERLRSRIRATIV